jgi:hypothetical protein
VAGGAERLHFFPSAMVMSTAVAIVAQRRATLWFSLSGAAANKILNSISVYKPRRLALILQSDSHVHTRERSQQTQRCFFSYVSPQERAAALGGIQKGGGVLNELEVDAGP